MNARINSLIVLASLVSFGTIGCLKDPTGIPQGSPINVGRPAANDAGQTNKVGPIQTTDGGSPLGTNDMMPVTDPVPAQTAEGEVTVDNDVSTNPAADSGSPTTDAGTVSVPDSGVVTTVDAGTNGALLTIKLSADTPVSRIILGGSSSYQLFTTYEITNTSNAPVLLTDITVTQPLNSNGYGADFIMTSVSIGTCSNNLAVLVNNLAKINVSGCGTLAVGKTRINLNGLVANTLPGATVAGDWTGSARSGHTPSLEIARVDAFGATITVANERAPKMVLRQAQPVITQQLLSTTMLTNGDQDLIKFQVSAQNMVAWKQATFNIEKSATVGLSNFRLRRGASDISSSIVAITDHNDGSNLVTVAFKAGQEETLVDSGNLYTLHANVFGATSGAYVVTQFDRDTTKTIVTGCLTNGLLDGLLGSLLPNLNVFNLGTSDGTATARGTFVWSDASELPHSPLLGTLFGSCDWTNDTLVDDLSQAQVLSR